MAMALDHTLIPDLTGKTVLDVGGYNGSAAKACLQRGAKIAIVIDSEQWHQYGWNGPTREDGPEFVTMDVMDWHEPVDFVVCSNVLYHQAHPWAFLAHLRKLTRDRLLLHTWIIEGTQNYWQIYSPGEGHPVSRTVVWKPMAPALGKLLANVGFTRVEQLGIGGDEPGGERITLMCQ